ncbi:TetR/AcrR family transcriptional regulator [Enterococcus hulanensis]|uniref:TetR/AcrR family transcriptional regulator n=1 Tax=Enterococcus hulanensis TaxID=2559929 RepID=UPI00288FEB2D|nr:TetR/AcrR family transcriptional regulator [Enterococcus hulanensis]MDT2658843.1 TetR/AcrR family transcriptional regulator [Enterococcus hulanensis]
MKKKDNTKITKILDATVQIILHEGAAAVSTVKVAKIVGIAQSNVYLYFKNKNDLLLSAYNRELEQIKAMGRLETLNDSNIPVKIRINNYIRSVFDYAIQHPDGLTLIEQIKMLNISEDSLYENNTIVINLLNEAISVGYLKKLPVNLHMTTVFNVLHRHALNIKEGLYDQQKYTYDAVAQMVLDALKA